MRLRMCRVAMEATRERLGFNQREETRITDEKNRIWELVLLLRQKAAKVEEQQTTLKNEQAQMDAELEQILLQRPILETQIRNLQSRFEQKQTAELAIQSELNQVQTDIRGVEKDESEIKVRMAELQSSMTGFIERLMGIQRAYQGVDNRSTEQEMQIGKPG